MTQKENLEQLRNYAKSFIMKLDDKQRAELWKEMVQRGAIIKKQ